MLEPVSDRQERDVAESAMLFLGAEMASRFRDDFGVETAMARLNAIGLAMGARLVTRVTAGRFPLTPERNALKYVGKDLWSTVFQKPASRLQIDRRGNYIIEDSSFRWLEQFTPPENSADPALHEAALLHLAFPCGVIRGALQAIGIECDVLAEVSVPALPACTFTVKLKGTDSKPLDTKTSV